MTPAEESSFSDSDVEIIEAPELPLIRELVEYWESKRRGRFAPSRADIDPAEMVKHLPHLHLLDVIEGGADFRFRLVGTAMARGLGRDNTGKRLSEIYADRPEVRRALIRRFALVLATRRPSYSRGRIWWLPDRSFRRFAGVSLPLSADGVTINMLLSEFVVL